MTTEDVIEPVTIDGLWNFGYTYVAGDAASRFFHELTRRRILGSLCPSCERVLVPARGFCDACYVETTEYRAVGHVGTVETFTIMTGELPGLPPPPFVVALVRLEGADTALLNAVTGVDLSDPDAAGAFLLTGPTVEVEFKDVCEGRITDFHFVVRP